MGLRWRILLLLGYCLVGCSTTWVMRQEAVHGKPAAGEPFEAVPPSSWHSLTRMESTVLALHGGAAVRAGPGGTLLYPAAEGTLRPGAFASIGLGMDNAR